MSVVSVFDASRQPLQENVQYFDSWDSYLRSGVHASGFWIGNNWTGDVNLLVDTIRRSPWWDRLVVSEEAHDHPALDGHDTFEIAKARIARADLAKQSLHVDFTRLIPAEKLLLYMYMRTDYELIPQYKAAAKSLYVYPIAEYLGAEEATMDWISRLTRSQLVSPVRLINRIRICKQCSGGHLSFVDVCSSCASIEVKHTPSLHCFTCGHSSRKGDFELEGALVCPKCQVRLRHIGVDYDLPTAQYACRKCNTFSMEQRIVAHCLDCDTKSEPEHLDVHEVYSLALNSRGMEALRQGQFHEEFVVTEDGNHVTPAYFKQMLHWASATHKRYNKMSFGVVLIEFTNVSELLSKLGAAKVYAMINEYTLRFRQVLRDSDVTSVDSAERLWVLLPVTTPEQIEAKLINKIKELQPQLGMPFEVRIRNVFAPRDIAGGDTPDNIMQTLIQR